MELSVLQEFVPINGHFLLRFSNFDVYLWFSETWTVKVTSRISWEYLQKSLLKKLTSDVVLSFANDKNLELDIDGKTYILEGEEIFDTETRTYTKQETRVVYKDKVIFSQHILDNTLSPDLPIQHFNSYGTGLFILHFEDATIQLQFNKVWSMIFGKKMVILEGEKEEENGRWNGNFQIRNTGNGHLILFSGITISASMPSEYPNRRKEMVKYPGTITFSGLSHQPIIKQTFEKSTTPFLIQ